MAQKPTSLAAQLSRDQEAQKIAEGKEDAAVAGKRIPAGKVMVRLQRDHYDAYGVWHRAGLAMLDVDAVPSTAKELTSKEVAAAEEGDE
jgi:hypothetical protein